LIVQPKHRIAKARRIVRRTGDDWAELSNKQFIDADRQATKKVINKELLEHES
jgi:hypothetical protein